MLKQLGCTMFAVFLLLGCAANSELLKKSQEDAILAVSEAKAMIEEARKANALRYAPELFESAESKLLVAEDSLKNSEHLVALNFAKKATADARLARDQALAAAAIDKAAVELMLAKAAGAEEKAKVLFEKASVDLEAARKSFLAKDYEGTILPAVKAYEEAAEARKLCELIKKASEMLAAAKIDIEDAEKAGAKKRAPELFKSALDNYAAGNSSFTEKDFLKAIDFAGKASDDAKAAKAASLAGVLGRYTVKRGDNLWNISKDGKVFDDPFLWPLLYKKNIDKIKNPDWIYPEQEFELPGSAGDAEKKEAVGDAFKYKKK